ncbi:MAG: uracil-DNA glycosylase [Oligoflexia bacterium]|nr:uracil-DNA glycosylase [Oligoflexia bacterium]
MNQLQQSLFQSDSTSSIGPTWKDVLAGEREEAYFRELLQFLAKERAQGKTIYPPAADMFNAIQFTPFASVKAVIIGQDPYHGPNQAHGLCFSVRRGIPPPPSLVNIFQELKTDLGLSMPSHGCLESWARQGVLLLNAVLSVEAGKPQSHANKGWERFTDRVIRELNTRREGLVFLLWGAYAWKKGAMIDRSKHLVLQAPHPSPLSAHRGFLGCKHFSQANKYLESRGGSGIDWCLEA